MRDIEIIAQPEVLSTQIIDRDVVVAFADEIEYHRFVIRQGAYAEVSRRPSTLVYASGGHSDLKKSDERSLRGETLSNRSIWIRNPDSNASQGAFVCAIKGAKDCGGLLFDEIYNSELQLRAQRLHSAFLALGLKSWRIDVEEETASSVNSETKAKTSAGAKVMIVEADAAGSVEKSLVEKFEKTLRQHLSVSFNESSRNMIDHVKAEIEIRKLGLVKDPVVSALLTARKRESVGTIIDQNLDFSFSGEIERKIDLAFHVAMKILFVSANMKGEYQSFKKAIQKVKNSVRIHVED